MLPYPSLFCPRPKVLPVNKLRIPLSAVSGKGGYALEERVDEAALRPVDAPESSITGVSVTGTLVQIDSDLLFRGSLVGVFQRPCDRCLEPAIETVECEVAWYFERGVAEERLEASPEYSDENGLEEDADGQRVRYFEGDEVDLAPHVWEEMILAGPSKFYCVEDCKGLCPSCGTNLNQGTCTCASEQEDSGSGMAALKEMFPNLPSESLEE